MWCFPRCTSRLLEHYGVRAQALLQAVHQALQRGRALGLRHPENHRHQSARGDSHPTPDPGYRGKKNYHTQKASGLQVIPAPPVLDCYGNHTKDQKSKSLMMSSYSPWSSNGEAELGDKSDCLGLLSHRAWTNKTEVGWWRLFLEAGLLERTAHWNLMERGVTSSRLVSGRSNILLTLASRLSHLTARVSHLKVLRLSGGLTRWSSHLPFPCLFSIFFKKGWFDTDKNESRHTDPWENVCPAARGHLGDTTNDSLENLDALEIRKRALFCLSKIDHLSSKTSYNIDTGLV